MEMASSGTRMHCWSRSRYRLRWFNSRQAGLVLAWNMLTVTAVTVVGTQGSYLFSKIHPNSKDWTTIATAVLVHLVVIVAALLFGRLADFKYGNYRIFKTGSLILFATAVLYCLISIVVLSLHISGIVIFILLALLYGIAIFGVFVCYSVILQLGLDQMPDASSDNITSYIFWYSGSIVGGVWIGNAIYLLLTNCISHISSESIEMVISLVPVMFIGCVLCSVFLLGRKLLIIESASPQSLKIILRVLKFAAKHKSPLNRSALTYWEEDIPSRMDLAKMRYGGPFTTEQVEDVKTFLRLLVVFLPLWLIVPALTTHDRSLDVYTKLSQCTRNLASLVSYKPLWCTILFAFLHELCIWPLINIRLPSLLKRIGIASMITLLLNVAHLCWTISSSNIPLLIHSSNYSFDIAFKS